MATRPVFVPNLGEGSLVREVDAEFEWHPGFSKKQKRKNIKELHASANEKGISPVLEISTKSQKEIGKKLSAFNLKVIIEKKHKMTVESAYQASKVFENGGPFTELYDKPPREAKKDSRLRESGDLVSFNLKGDVWGLEPKTAFYDWIYVNALHQHGKVKNEIKEYEGFTDIEFNPKKSVNCQARGAALYVSLTERGLLRDVLRDKEVFREVIATSSHKSIERVEDMSNDSSEKGSRSNEDLWVQGNLFRQNRQSDS